MGEVLTATLGGLKRPRLTLGLGASLLLVPISFLGARIGSSSGAADLVTYEADFDVVSAPAPVPAVDAHHASVGEVASRRPEDMGSPEPARATAGPSGRASAGSAVAPPSSKVESTPSTTTTVLTSTKGEDVTVATPPAAPSGGPINVKLPLNLGSTLQRLTAGTSEAGQASWFQAPGGTCAHQTLPFGTLVKVTHLYNGTSTTCRVDDRGPFITGRVIDLSYDTFEKLAHPGSGVINVVLEW